MSRDVANESRVTLAAQMLQQAPQDAPALSEVNLRIVLEQPVNTGVGRRIETNEGFRERQWLGASPRHSSPPVVGQTPDRT